MEFHDLADWLWDSLPDFAVALGLVLSISTTPVLGKLSAKACIARDTAKIPPKSFNVFIDSVIISIKLSFGTFFGACFKCNRHGHYVRSCPGSSLVTLVGEDPPAVVNPN